MWTCVTQLLEEAEERIPRLFVIRIQESFLRDSKRVKRLHSSASPILRHNYCLNIIIVLKNSASLFCKVKEHLNKYSQHFPP